MNATGPGTAAADLLASLDWIDLGRYSVIGPYLRFDHRTRSALKEFRQRVVASLSAQSTHPKNFLVWGAPGTGKSYLIQQIARMSKASVNFVEVNVAGLSQEAFRAQLEGLDAIPGSVLCLIDEVDSRPADTWPYETLLPFLEPSTPRKAPTCYCLAGSGGGSLTAFKDGIRGRPKGADLLSRIPQTNEVAIEALEVGDRLLVSTVQLMLAAAAEGRDIREVEKFAMYY